MSLLWRYDSDICDGNSCCGDCDECKIEGEEEEKE